MKRSQRFDRRLELLTSPAMVLCVWHECRLELHRRALAAQLHGVSWRGQRYGQSSLCVDRQGQYRFIDSANYKPHDHDDPRHCAEEEPLAVAAQEGLVIVCMAVGGPPQTDDFTGIFHIATAPCGKSCRPLMAAESAKPNGVIRPYSRLDLINVETREIWETHIAEMLSVFGHVTGKGAVA